MRGYYFCLASIVLAATIILVFIPAWWSLLLFVLCLGRLLVGQTRFSKLIIVLVVGLVVSYLGLVKASGHSQLTGQEDQLLLQVKRTDIAISGDLAKFSAQVSLANGQREQVQVFYWLKNEADRDQLARLKGPVTMQVKAKLESPSPARNRGAFDYRKYLKGHGIHWLVTIQQIEGLTDQKGFLAWWDCLLFRLLIWLESLAQPRLRAYLLALFFNRSHQLDAEALAAYQAVGLIHLFSISGFHLNYFLKSSQHCLLRLGFLKEHSQMLVFILLLIYASLLGWPYGMVRAVVAYTFRQFCLWKNWPPDSLSGSCLSFILILLVRPLALFSLGFQLTYALTAAIIFLGPRVKATWSRPVVQELVLSFICCLTTIPFLVHHFHRFSWASLILNYFFSWAFANLVFPALLLVVCLHGLGLANQLIWLQELMAGCLGILESISQFNHHWQMLNWTIGLVPAWVLAGFTVILLYLARHFDQDGHLTRGQLGLLFVSLILLYNQAYLDPYGRLAMLDIGQGDTIYLELPYQRATYLVDVAEQPTFPKPAWAQRPRQSLVSRQILPALQAEGVRHLDGVFISHGDFDHMGGLNELLSQVKVKILYLPIGMQDDQEALASIASGLASSLNPRIQVIWLQAGDQVYLGAGYQAQVLAPSQVGQGENKDSLVLYTKLGPASVLLTGDVEGQAEHDVYHLLADQGLPVDILKVAHHGSDNSSPSQGLDLIKPKTAWISAGLNNRYGHPHDRVISDLENLGAEIYRTDQDGAVHYRFRPRSGIIDRMINEEGS
ncbi:hypothetical protein AWM75_02840 [Aerococcus urinaehominis]|uniref:Uncharacterized protein n=1 Tax=Aerococcus urinaehominis TaxID=128944 RepID=A0A0X8FKH7_9LACT|nr:DNA internalization-related competence protein ComEC/Rec2 [Aerococcus urinaehominis]AMB98998.1 hypothetical protein AWM75_02840 [Aerococcus urinaehominis]SDM62128.1 competence protein ComEC [Aerococcus urinaehominis]